jgi:hypothetical protein
MYNMDDPNFQNNIENKFSPKHRWWFIPLPDKLYFGFSVPNF